MMGDEKPSKKFISPQVGSKMRLEQRNRYSALTLRQMLRMICHATECTPRRGIARCKRHINRACMPYKPSLHPQPHCSNPLGVIDESRKSPVNHIDPQVGWYSTRPFGKQDENRIGDLKSELSVAEENYKELCNFSRQASRGVYSSRGRAHSASSTASSSSWGDNVCIGRLNEDLFSIGASSLDSEEGMFLPEPVIQLSNVSNNPKMPYHTKEELQPGKRVWVVDEEDVETFLSSNWWSAYELVCNGRMSGTITRHNGDMTIVLFHDDTTDLYFSLTLPRPCLSLKPIAPYENPNRMNNRALGTYYSNVALCTVQGKHKFFEKEDWMHKQQYYECLSVLEVPTESLSVLGDAQECFRKGDLEEALNLVSKQLLGLNWTEPHYAEALTLRSRILVFMEKFGDALVDGVRCAEVEPRWVRGYLCMARAHSGLGNFLEANAALRRASALFQNSLQLEEIKDMNAYLIRVQQSLEKNSNGNVVLTLDSMYRKRLFIRSSLVPPNYVLFRESTPILAMPSIFSKPPLGRCDVCFRDGAEELEMSASTNTDYTSTHMQRAFLPSKDALKLKDAGCGKGDGDATCSSNSDGDDAPEFLPIYFCSKACLQRATLFARLETKHKDNLRRARELICSKAHKVRDLHALEILNMTMRLFFMVITAHRSLTAQWHIKHSCRDNTDAFLSRDFPAQVLTKVSLKCLLSSLSMCKTHTELDAKLVDGSNDDTYGALRCSPVLPLSISVALRHLGIYPLVNDRLSNDWHRELATVYQTLTAGFREEMKKLYNERLFSSLYNYTSNYFTPVDLPLGSLSPSCISSTTSINIQKTSFSASAPASADPVYYLPFLAGCAARQELSLVQQRGEGGSRHVACRLPEKSEIHTKVFGGEGCRASSALESLEEMEHYTANCYVQFVDPSFVLASTPQSPLSLCITHSIRSASSALVQPTDFASTTSETTLPLLEVVTTRTLHCSEPLTFLPLDAPAKD